MEPSNEFALSVTPERVPEINVSRAGLTEGMSKVEHDARYDCREMTCCSRVDPQIVRRCARRDNV